MPKPTAVADTEDAQISLDDTPDLPEHGIHKSPSPYSPTSFLSKLGMPPLPGSRVKFPAMVEYWRSLTTEQRSHISVYTYRLFPVINLPKNEHAIAIIPGESPIGGEDGPPEEAMLAAHGLGDYWFCMKYAGVGMNKEICRAWLQGYTDHLPGWRDFKNHPPLIGSVGEVVLDNEKNIKSGYITYLRSVGQLPGEAATENEESMAERTAGAVAMEVLGDIAKRSLDNKDTAPPAPHPVEGPRQPEWEAIDRTIKTVNSIHEQNSVNPVEFLKTAAEILRPADPVPPDNTILNAIVGQNTKLQETIIGLHGERADDLKDQLNGLRQDMRHMMDRATAPSPVSAASPIATPTDPVDALINQAERFGKLKSALGFPSAEDDDGAAPRRRRRASTDDEDEPAPGKSVWASMAENLPTIMGMGLSLINGISLAIHNGRVLATGQGETVAPDMPNMPVDQSHNPAFAATPQYHTPPVAALPPGSPQPTPTGATPLQMEVTAFLQRIEPGLLRAFDRGKTGYEYAETFIESFGRTGGLFAYSGLKAAGNLPIPGLKPLEGACVAFDRLAPNLELSWARMSVPAILSVLSMYAPIWSKIGNDPRLLEFLAEFVTYDELLKDNNAVDLMALVTQFEDCNTVQQALDAIDTDDADGGDGEDGEEPDGAAGAGGATIDLKVDGPAPVPASVKPPRAVKGKGVQ